MPVSVIPYRSSNFAPATNSAKSALTCFKVSYIDCCQMKRASTLRMPHDSKELLV